MTLTEAIAIGFFTGFAGSLHCAGMCGPIALIIPGSRSEGMRFILGRFFYNGGRVVTYALLGVLFGILGQRLELFGLQQVVSLIAGSLIILFVISNYFYPPGFPKFNFGFIGKIKFYLGKFIGRKSMPGMFTTGVLNGILPCGLVYVALGIALVTGSVGGSVLLMTAFGLGTFPVMLSISVLGKSFSPALRLKLLKAVPLMIAVVGVLLLLRGLDLGIPFISPHKHTIESSTDVICQ